MHVGQTDRQTVDWRSPSKTNGISATGYSDNLWSITWRCQYKRTWTFDRSGHIWGCRQLGVSTNKKKKIIGVSYDYNRLNRRARGQWYCLNLLINGLVRLFMPPPTALCFQVVRPAVRSLTPTWRNAISHQLLARFQWNSTQIFTMWAGTAEEIVKVIGSKVKVTCVQVSMQKNGGGIHKTVWRWGPIFQSSTGNWTSGLEKACSK